jgi:predicted dehydrogenase
MLDVLNKYVGINCYTDYKRLLVVEKPDAIFIATPSRFHGEIVKVALNLNIHVFCEKPFCLDIVQGQQLADLAESKGLVNQVGYHYRFVGTFQEMKRLVDAGVIGQVHHVRAEAYGPVVLKKKGSTWRASKIEGGGCLYDYACHAIDLVNYIVGRPDSVGGTVLNKIFSRHVEDEVYSTFFYSDGKTAQISANWSDESFRKMSTKVSIWGSNGRIIADKQELQIYLRDGPNEHFNLNKGWNTRFTTELTKEVWYYLRGEEYSAQVDHFVQNIKAGCVDTISTFRSALETDFVAAMMIKDAESGRDDPSSMELAISMPIKKKSGVWFFNKLLS